MTNYPMAHNNPLEPRMRWFNKFTLLHN